MVDARELPVLITLSFLIIFLPMLFLFNASNLAIQEGLTEVGNLFSDGATLLLFMLLFSIIILAFIRQGAFGNAPNLLSGGSSQLIGAGMTAFLIIWFIVIQGSGAIQMTFDIPIQSLIQLPIQAIFSQIGEALLQPYWSYVLIGLAGPISEELVFGLAIPTIVFAALFQIADQFGILDGIGQGPTTFLIAIFTIAFTASVFALFHVTQQANIAFVVASIAFRSITLLLAYSDAFLGLIPVLQFGIGGMWGIHIANNIILLTTLPDFIGVLIAGDGTILSGIFTLTFFLFFIVAFGSAIQTIVQVAEGQMPGEDS